MVLLLIAVAVAGLLSWVVNTTAAPAQVKTLFNVAFVVTCVVLTVRVLELAGIKVL